MASCKESDLFVPQLHGREHVNVYHWLSSLRAGRADFIEAFKRNMFSIDFKSAQALNYTNFESKFYLRNIIRESSAIFKSLFGHKSESFIAPNYTWDDDIEEDLKQEGINFLQGSKKQNKPQINKGSKSVWHYTGQKNKLGQTYLVRNCLFEPSISPELDYVSICLKHIENSFIGTSPQ